MERRTAILITAGKKTIDGHGSLRNLVKTWNELHGTWWYRLGTAPKKPEDILEVYWTIGGRVRYKSRLLEVQHGWVEFETGEHWAKNWLVLFDFQPLPRHEQRHIKGFQGFRYYTP